MVDKKLSFKKCLNEDYEYKEYSGPFQTRAEYDKAMKDIKALAPKGWVYEVNQFLNYDPDYPIFAEIIAEPIDHRDEKAYEKRMVMEVGKPETLKEDNISKYHTLAGIEAWKSKIKAKDDENEDEDEEDYDSKYKDIDWSFHVYELGEDGEEVDNLGEFDTEELAIDFAKNQSVPTHVVFVPKIDPDDDPDYEDYLEMFTPYKAYEVIWESESFWKNEDSEESLDYYDDSIDECVHNYYDVETAHEFVGLDDIVPKIRKFDGKETEIDYDDDF